MSLQSTFMFETLKSKSNPRYCRYVDSQPAEEMRANRGTIIEPGKDSRFRTRSVAENMKLFEEMAAGKHAEGVQIPSCLLYFY